jgi:threonine/homoserine/homoserine lactone efflux protein
LLFYLIQGATLALSATLMPGPFQAFLISYALRNGWKRTLPAALAPLLTDGPVIVLVLFVLTKTPQWSLNILHVAGGFVILYLAWRIFRSLKDRTPHLRPMPDAARKTLFSAVAMNVLNPNPYIFWSVVAGPILLEAWHQSKSLGIGFVSGFYGTFVLCLATFILMFGSVGRVNPRVNRILCGISACALSGFGFYELATGVARLATYFHLELVSLQAIM